MTNLNITQEVTATHFRDVAGDVIGRVEHGENERIGITRHGRVAAVLISVKELAIFEALEDAADLADAQAADAEDDGYRISADELHAELGL